MIDRGITVFPTHDLITTEGGEADEFNVVLNREPEPGTTYVSLEISTDDVTEGLVQAGGAGPAEMIELAFTGPNWLDPQVVTVVGQPGVSDGESDPRTPYTVITGDTASDDPAYDGLTADDVADVEVVNADDFADPGITVTSEGSLVTLEHGTRDEFTVVLGFQSRRPHANRSEHRFRRRRTLAGPAHLRPDKLVRAADGLGNRKG